MIGGRFTTRALGIWGTSHTLQNTIAPYQYQGQQTWPAPDQSSVGALGAPPADCPSQVLPFILGGVAAVVLDRLGVINLGHAAAKKGVEQARTRLVAAGAAERRMGSYGRRGHEDAVAAERRRSRRRSRETSGSMSIAERRMGSYRRAARLG